MNEFTKKEKILLYDFLPYDISSCARQFGPWKWALSTANRVLARFKEKEKKNQKAIFPIETQNERKTKKEREQGGKKKLSWPAYFTVPLLQSLVPRACKQAQ